MLKKIKPFFFILLGLSVLGIPTLFILNNNIPVLNPKGAVAAEQLNLLITATLLMLIVVIPVFVMVITFAWRYRESNTKSKYTPEWDGHRLIELIWWTIPIIIIGILSVIIWNSSHKLDPYRKLDSSKKPVTVQVVALEWKWLFIYPEENIASINFLQFPEDTPVNFEITSDAPMNSFWIPQLGGQVYAMSGMKTKLHLIADEPGDYQGSSANLSGEGFAGMKFTAKATSESDYKKWLESARQSDKSLSQTEYSELAKPSQNNQSVAFRSVEAGLYDNIIHKYMSPNTANTPPVHEHSATETGATHHH